MWPATHSMQTAYLHGDDSLVRGSLFHFGDLGEDVLRLGGVLLGSLGRGSRGHSLVMVVAVGVTLYLMWINQSVVCVCV